MSDEPSWRPLPVYATGIPSLLISCAFTSQSYMIKITDLANVWSETMDRRALVKRGLEEDISIDLTDGPDQIKRMLDYVRAAFDPGDAEHGNTSLNLSGSDDGRESLVVNLTCIMPKTLNLKPLEWPMILAKEPQTAISTALVLPLLQVYKARVREIDELISELRGKDGVIAKVVDKLEATGTGLEHVFSALAGKRKVTKALAEQRVKGLAPFNESSFKATQKEAAESATADVGTLLDSVFGGDGLKWDSGISDQSTFAEWWKKLGGGKHVTLVDRGKSKQDLQPPTVESQAHSVEEDEFQVQDTPPGRKRRQAPSSSPVPQAPVPQAPAHVHDDDETTDDDSDDLDSGPAPSTQPKSFGSRIGAIGGQKQAPMPAPRPTVAPVVSPKKPVQNDSDTASDSDDQDASAPAPSHAVSSPQPKTTGIGRIGGIGSIGGLGGRGKQTAEPETAPSPSPAEETRGRPREAKEEQDDETLENSKEEPRETSTERADRKRRELRQEQQARAAAGPAKKKRRF
ncbi:XLF-domain-containing protein [Thozetella sp. PMI_491]|nr:XLF-domain-containing protein [Thozetella sp. PMI_491]